MRVNIVKVSSWRIPRKFVEIWLNDLAQELYNVTGEDIRSNSITLAFVSSSHIKKLNKKFRLKDRATDILSFEDPSGQELGELALCGKIVERQAKDHSLHLKEELGYLIVHGVLHLLGYEHEMGGKREKEMMTLQDNLFELLCEGHFNKSIAKGGNPRF